ncbi:MAG: response regulator [Planctomycetota bacterium]
MPREAGRQESEESALRRRVRELEAQLAGTQSRGQSNPYRELFERSADAILIIDGDTFVDCNEATVRMLRYGSRDELLQTHPSELSPEFQPDGRPSFEKANEMIAIAFEKGSHRFEWDHQRADGELLPVEVLLTCVPEADRKMLHVVWREISERRRLEQDLRHAQKMEAVGKLAGGIAHDFNNILVAIMGYADMIRAEVAGCAELEADVDEIIRASQRAATLTSQLLAFGRKQDLQPEVIDLTRLVQDLAGMIQRLIGEDIHMILDPAGVPLLVKVDPAQLEQVILNVAANARDAMPDGGTLTLRTGMRDGISRKGRGRSTGRFASLEFEDTGSGMSREVLDRAFEPFFTTKEMGRGTGLGLASVYGIIKQSGGDVEILSRVGCGTTVRILLPESSESAVRAGTGAPPPAPPVPGGETILLVEDDVAAGRLLRRVLEREGYRVILARNGKDALALREESAERLDMLLTDVIMPVLSGPELVSIMREHQPGLPALFMSGYTDDVLARHGFSAADVDLVRKPFSPRELVRRVGEFLAVHGREP